MKTILVPTDFSKNADKAVAYAVKMAAKENARLILLHAYTLAYMNPATPFKLVEAEASTIEKAARTKLRRICSTMRKKLTCEYQVKRGFTVNVILDTIYEKRVDLVIMGTKGASGLKEVFMGSTTSQVIAKAKCPVLAVPENASLRKLKNMVYASDFRSSDITTISKLAESAKLFKAHIRVVHISDSATVSRSERELIEDFMTRIRKEAAYDNISFTRIGGKNPAKSLRKYIDENAPDLFAMSTHGRTMLDRLFGSSVTRKVVQHTQVPLLAFHHKESSLTLS